MTDPQRGVAVLKDPALLVFPGVLGLMAEALPDPCLILARGYEPGLLRELKVRKLRGLGRFLAVGGAELPLERVPQSLQPVKGLSVVSGLKRTVLSTTRTAEEILRDDPELVADVSGMKEEI